MIGSGVISMVWQLFVALVLLTLSIAWTPQRGKWLFVAFVATGILGAGLFDLAAFFLASMSIIDAYIVIVGCEFLASFLRFGSSILLILFVIVRFNGDNVLTSYVPANQSLGLTWNIDIPPYQHVTILRRREWGFLIDFIPGFLMFLCFFIHTMTARNFFSSIWLNSVLLLLAIIQFVYLPLKDVVAGRSIGKIVSGCRVVDAKHGTIADVEKLIVRNLILLIPLMPFVELLVASFRPDRKRLGDLIAGTMVVHGPPVSINGIALPAASDLPAEEPKHVPHPLDD